MLRTERGRTLQDISGGLRTGAQMPVQKGEKKQVSKLIRYSETPQVTGLEYSEQRDLKKHPEKKKHYEDVVRQRIRMDARRK